MTYGNHHQCACPYCGKFEREVTRGVTIQDGRTVTFLRQCFGCKETVHYQAQIEVWVMAMTAKENERHEKLRRSKQ